MVLAASKRKKSGKKLPKTMMYRFVGVLLDDAATANIFRHAQSTWALPQGRRRFSSNASCYHFVNAWVVQAFLALFAGRFQSTLRRYDCQKDCERIERSQRLCTERSKRLKKWKKRIGLKLSMRLNIFAKIVCASFERWVFQPLFFLYNRIELLQQEIFLLLLDAFFLLG